MSESRALDPADGYGDTDADALAAAAALYAPPLLADYQVESIPFPHIKSLDLVRVCSGP